MKQYDEVEENIWQGKNDTAEEAAEKRLQEMRTQGRKQDKIRQPKKVGPKENEKIRKES